ncbi:uncharacterized protein L201_000467 [Kwoniella dendrophila CBS 6074]|uniref:Peptidase A1 domain-containing protein n=1 Tax=Kwoniella dendrophila CBS 6074 TaxID=1295534 RepID=A0AAX4JMH7_9TREE
MSSKSMTEVWIGAASPLLSYTPTPVKDPKNRWQQTQDGSNQYTGQDAFAIELANFYFTKVAFFFTSQNNNQMQLNLDGSIQNADSNSEKSLTAPFGSHTIKIQGEGGGTLNFQGIEVETQVVESFKNLTLDDASKEITYSGFKSTSSMSSDVAAIQQGSFHEKTVSYTSSGGSTAAFSFQGSAIYLFGMTGPGFGCFQVSIDSKVVGTFNASTTMETYDTLLYFTTYLDQSRAHQVTITNQNDGMLFALDYLVYVAPDNQNTLPATASVPGATAVFPSQMSNSSQSDTGTGDSAGAVIGGILGTIAGLFLLWILWRYRQWKKGGGSGTFMAALCGGMRVKKEEKKEEKKFHLWPMVWSRPKYAT